MGDVEELKRELQDLKLQMAHIKREEEPKFLFSPKQRKIEKFSGKSDDQTVYDFIDDVTRVLDTRPTSAEEKGDFLISHLEGPAREEIKYRHPAAKKTPKQILDILRETFGERATPSELTADFYGTKQEDGQSLQEFCHVLMKKLDRIVKVDNSFVTEPEKMLRNQFAENVNDTWLRRELKKLVRAKSAIPFTELREEAIVLSMDRDEKEVNLRKKREVPIYAEAASTEMADFMKEMKEELSSLLSEIRSIKEEKSVERKERRCYGCRETGHIRKNCPKTHLNSKGLLSGASQ